MPPRDALPRRHFRSNLAPFAPNHSCCPARGILRHPSSPLDASHQALRRVAMREQLRRGIRQHIYLTAALLAAGASCAAQQPEGPQADAPPPVAPKPAVPQQVGSDERITVPAGTRVGVVLQNGISPRSANSGGKETMDSEGKVTSPGGKGKDAGTIAETTAAGAGIGAIAGRAKGLGIGAGIGAAAGLAAVLLTRGPEAELPRGSTLDIVLEHDLSLDGSQIQFTNLGQAQPITPPPSPQP